MIRLSLPIRRVHQVSSVVQEYLNHTKLNVSLQEFNAILNTSTNPTTPHQQWEQQVFEACKQDGDLVKGVADFIIKTKADGGMDALRLYKISMDYGKNDAAGVSYATLLYRGTGGAEKDVQRASVILNKLAKKGNPAAQMNYATLLQQQGGGNEGRVKELLELAHQSGGQVEATSQLGSMHLKEGKVELAIEYLDKAAAQGHAKSAYVLATLYASPLKQDWTRAFQYYVKAATGGLVEAQYNLGHCYMTGQGTRQDLQLAREYWTLAADQGFPLAQINVGKMYMDGHGVPQDKIKAKMYFEQVVKGTSVHAQQAALLLQQLETKESKEQGWGCVVM